MPAHALKGVRMRVRTKGEVRRKDRESRRQRGGEHERDYQMACWLIHITKVSGMSTQVSVCPWQDMCGLEWGQVSDHLKTREAAVRRYGLVPLRGVQTNERITTHWSFTIPGGLLHAGRTSIGEVRTAQSYLKMSLSSLTSPMLSFFSPGGWFLWGCLSQVTHH